VVQPAYHLPDEELTGPLTRVVRRAGPADEDQIRRNKIEAKRGMLLFRELAGRHELDLKPIAAELVFDQSRIVFSFSSDERPDTRALQTDLGARLKRRVELRQVGPREQGRLCGEVGLCGTGRLCSARYPCHDQPITLKMAKEQDLPMNPGRITGLCGRLRCCLAFEHPLYRSFRDRAPAVGRAVATPNGRGIVRSYEVLKDACVVELDGRTMVEITLDQMVEVAG
jgi:cell fate regulator YaaT (PSP1 superfamily)